MNNSFLKSIVAGIIATIAMTAMVMMGNKMGMPKMEPPKMLATTMGLPVTAGWAMHFGLGVMFALMYTYIFRGMLAKISSTALRGAVFGVIAFVLSRVGMLVMAKMFPAMPVPAGSMALMMMGALMGHVLFGVVTALIVGRASSHK